MFASTTLRRSVGWKLKSAPLSGLCRGQAVFLWWLCACKRDMCAVLDSVTYGPLLVGWAGFHFRYQDGLTCIRLEPVYHSRRQAQGSWITSYFHYPICPYYHWWLRQKSTMLAVYFVSVQWLILDSDDIFAYTLYLIWWYYFATMSLPMLLCSFSNVRFFGGPGNCNAIFGLVLVCISKMSSQACLIWLKLFTIVHSQPQHWLNNLPAIIPHSPQSKNICMKVEYFSTLCMLPSLCLSGN